MILLEVHFSLGAAFTAFALSITAMLFTYVRQIIKDRFYEQPFDKSTSNKISDHFKKLGYDVRTVLPDDGINKWLVAIIKNGKEQIINVFENGDEIQVLVPVH